MGDRGNIAVLQSQGQVWFYTHWNGSEIKEVVQKALARKQRWTDESYLARIVFDELCPSRGEDIGFGISTCIGDNSHPIVVVDCLKQRVFEIDESELTDKGQVPENWEPKKAEGFAVFAGVSA